MGGSVMSLRRFSSVTPRRCCDNCRGGSSRPAIAGKLEWRGWILQLIVALTVVMQANWAIGHTTVLVTRTCPFTGRVFAAEVEGSGTLACQRLDLKPVGPIGAPGLVPICPDDGFVVYKESFSRREIEGLRAWVASRAFRRLVRCHTPYFRLAKIQERLGEDERLIAESYLKASWEAESDPARYKRYARRAVIWFDRYATDLLRRRDERTGGAVAEARIVAADLLRRLGRFEAASRRLAPAIGLQRLSWLDRVWLLELALVKKRDRAPAYLPDDQPWCRDMDREHQPLSGISSWAPLCCPRVRNQCRRRLLSKVAAR